MSPAMQALLSASGLAAAGFAVWLALRLRTRAGMLAVGWRVDADQPLWPDDPGALRGTGRTDFTLGGDLLGSYDSLVDDPSVVVLRLRNAGRRPIRNDDWGARLAFTFPGRAVVAAEVAETEEARVTARHLVDFHFDQVPPGGSKLVIWPVSLDPRDKAVTLAVLLSGRGYGIQASGLLRNGTIVKERPRRLRLRVLP
jgi:hypothetical protein